MVTNTATVEHDAYTVETQMVLTIRHVGLGEGSFSVWGRHISSTTIYILL